MEMVQFHPTGLYAGTHTRMTGTVLEEGLRGAGGYLLNGAKQRFMPAYDPKAERATRDFVSRAMYAEMKKGNASPNGGLYLSMSHLNQDFVKKQFRGMVERCADCGFDLAGGLVEVVPTAHYMMGGVEFAPDCSTELKGLFVAGEDAGGVHGANRLGGNGVANSTVFGAVAGDTMADWVRRESFRDPDARAIENAIESCEPKTAKSHGSLEPLRERLYDVMWEKVGIIRSEAGLRAALSELNSLEDELNGAGIAGADRAFNLSWHDWLNMKNLLATSRVIAEAALARTDSRGAHFREDFPEAGSLERSAYTSMRMQGGKLVAASKPVAFTRVKPGESLLGAKTESV
jgi:fumarate reductase flavoprotein subunit